MTTEAPTWNPLTDWRPREVDWVRVDINKEDLKRFTKRSNVKGLAHAIGFLLIVAATGAVAYYGFATQRWVIMVLGLYLHGTVYKHFGDAIHEMTHNTVFESRKLSRFMTYLFGWFFWPYNPYLYKLSHQGYHHRYTLHQEADGEDVANYAEFGPKLIYQLFFKVFDLKGLVKNVGRLLTLRPTSHVWRPQAGFQLDPWEQFILREAREGDRRDVYNFAHFALFSHIAFALICLAIGQPFLLVLITFAPFYGPAFHGYLCATHQHAGCDVNHPDFRVSCGDAKLDPLSSFLYWHMEYHIEHHMFAGIPCYNLKAFSEFVADQLPKKEPAIQHLKKVARISREKFGSLENWRLNYGVYKGL